MTPLCGRAALLLWLPLADSVCVAADPAGAGLHAHRPGTGLHRYRVSVRGVCGGGLLQPAAEQVL